jgi:hypothetical protein
VTRQSAEKFAARQSELNELSTRIADIGGQIANHNLDLTQAAWESYFQLQERAIVAQKRIVHEQMRWAKTFGIEL